jgi:2-C-methyl-D-erythritol 4-phosphate cytidylyltransferase
MNIAIILTGGNSTRTKPINKIFYPIKKKPLIYYTLLAFEKNPEIQKIILVAKKSDFKIFLSLIKKLNFRKIEKITEGGKERQDSCFNGLKAAGKLGPKKNDLILFHNGSNPLVSQEEIKKVIEAAREYGAALVAHKAKDTIKKVNEDGFVLQTIPRERIYLAQTPQAIKYGLAKKAFEKAYQDKFYGTDDISLVERIGKPIKIVPAASQNIKVTYPEDFEFVEAYIRKYWKQ